MIHPRIDGSKVTMTFTAGGIAAIIGGIAKILGYDIASQTCEALGMLIIGGLLIFAKE